MSYVDTAFYVPKKPPGVFWKIVLILLVLLIARLCHAEPLNAGSVPDVSFSVLRVFGSLVLVVALFLGGVWLFRNWQRVAVRSGRMQRLNVLETRSLGNRHSLCVIGYEQQRFLLASSPAGVQMLASLPDGETDEPAERAANPNFALAFQKVLAAKA